jgi:MFS family permease
MTDRGVSSERLAVIAVIYSSALAVFKFANGFMYDKFGLRITITLDFFAALGSFLVLYFIDDSPASVYFGIVYAILAGMALPLETVILPIYAKDLFGQKSFAKVLGIFVSLNQVGYALGDPMMNLSFTLTGSYDTGIIISIVLVVVTIIGIQFVINSANKIKKQDFAK